jgi:hypothetical protein
MYVFLIPGQGTGVSENIHRISTSCLSFGLIAQGVIVIAPVFKEKHPKSWQFYTTPGCIQEQTMLRLNYEIH